MAILTFFRGIQINVLRSRFINIWEISENSLRIIYKKKNFLPVLLLQWDINIFQIYFLLFEKVASNVWMFLFSSNTFFCFCINKEAWLIKKIFPPSTHNFSCNKFKITPACLFIRVYLFMRQARVKFLQHWFSF